MTCVTELSKGFASLSMLQSIIIELDCSHNWLILFRRETIDFGLCALCVKSKPTKHSRLSAILLVFNILVCSAVIHTQRGRCIKFHVLNPASSIVK